MPFSHSLMAPSSVCEQLNIQGKVDIKLLLHSSWHSSHECCCKWIVSRQTATASICSTRKSATVVMYIVSNYSMRASHQSLTAGKPCWSSWTVHFLPLKSKAKHHGSIFDYFLKQSAFATIQYSQKSLMNAWDVKRVVTESIVPLFTQHYSQGMGQTEHSLL